MTEFNKLNVLVVGLGSIGMRHMRNLKALGINNVYGMDPDNSKHADFINETGNTAYTDLSSAVKEKPDLSVISSPNYLHIEQAQTCADAGSHLFIEKPLGTSLNGVNLLIQTIQEKNLFAHVGSNWKFHKSFKLMKDLIKKNEIGQITSAQIIAGQWLPDWHPWEDYRKGYSARKGLGGGIIFDSHEFDNITWLLGPISEINGFIQNSGALEIDTEDVACICIRMKSGALVTMQLDYIQRHPQRRYFISGIGGSIEWDINKNQLILLKKSRPEPTVINVSDIDQNSMYIDQMKHVLNGLHNNRKLPITSVSNASIVLQNQLKIKMAA